MSIPHWLCPHGKHLHRLFEYSYRVIQSFKSLLKDLILTYTIYQVVWNDVWTIMKYCSSQKYHSFDLFGRLHFNHVALSNAHNFP